MTHQEIGSDQIQETKFRQLNDTEDVEKRLDEIRCEDVITHRDERWLIKQLDRALAQLQSRHQ